MKKVLLSLFIALFLTSSCSVSTTRHAPLRRPSSLGFVSQCLNTLSALLTQRPKYAQQNQDLVSIHDWSVDFSKNFYNTNTFDFNRFTLTETQRKAMKLNLDEMTGVVRGDGVPYASHPIKLAIVSEKLIGNESEEAQRTFTYLLLHDILEEGQGTSPASLQRMKELFPEAGQDVNASYMLVEPDIHEINIPNTIPYSMIEVVGYGRQVVQFAQKNGDQSLINTSMIDKLFNLFDRFSVVERGLKEEENHLVSMQWRLAKQGYLLEKMQGKGNPEVEKYARALHENLRLKLGVRKKDVTAKIKEYKKIEATYKDQIDYIILREAKAHGLLL